MKKILVGLDGSPRAPGVLAYAESLADIAHAKLVLCRAFSIPPDMTLAWPGSDTALEAALRAQTQAYLDACAASLPRVDGVRVLLGSPWRAVCAAAITEDVDLIVVGSHGYSGIDHVIGTTAARIVDHADRPVLVVRTPTHPRA